MNRNEIIELLKIPYSEFEQTIIPRAKDAYRAARGNGLLATAMLGYSNICKNTCMYCGMSAQNKNLRRFRMPPSEIIETAKNAWDMGFTRIFMVSGEDPGFGFENILDAVRGVKEQGFYISLACGEWNEEEYAKLRDAGVDEYVLKFEMSDEDVFNRLNPSTNFAKRTESIRMVRKSGLNLASGAIVDYPGQTLEQLADDILFAKELGITWAPNIPYLPAPGTPLSEEGGLPGSLEKNLRHIAILRILMPDINITAQQPGRNPKNGLADEQGNLDALNADANILFYDLLPKLLEREFKVVENRNVALFEHLHRMSELSGMPLVF